MRRPTLCLLLAAVVFAAALPARAQKAVFVVRHAEKISEKDERLSPAGHERAAHLAAMLKDAGITAIYATNTERAQDTARPLSERLGLKITTYDTGGGMSGKADSRAFVEALRREHAGDIVLVVGHSNTIPDLLRTLGCSQAVSLAPNEYDNLFIVVPRPKEPATLLRLRY